MGLLWSSCFLAFVTVPVAARFAPRSARGCRMMRSGARNASSCFATFGIAEDPNSQRGHPAHRPHGNDHYLPVQAGTGACLLMRCERRRPVRRTHGRLTPSATRLHRSHAMEDDGKFARDRDAGLDHAAVAPRAFPPSLQRRPFPAARQQSVRCLIERGARELIAASAEASWISVSPD